MNVGLKYGFHSDEAAHTLPMMEDERRRWYHPGQHTSMLAFLVEGLFDSDVKEQGEWVYDEWE